MCNVLTIEHRPQPPQMSRLQALAIVLSEATSDGGCPVPGLSLGSPAWPQSWSLSSVQVPGPRVSSLSSRGRRVGLVTNERPVLGTSDQSEAGIVSTGEAAQLVLIRVRLRPEDRGNKRQLHCTLYHPRRHNPDL